MHRQWVLSQKEEHVGLKLERENMMCLKFGKCLHGSKAECEVRESGKR